MAAIALLAVPAHAQDISINFGQGAGLTERRQLPAGGRFYLAIGREVRRQLEQVLAAGKN